MRGESFLYFKPSQGEEEKTPSLTQKEKNGRNVFNRALYVAGAIPSCAMC